MTSYQATLQNFVLNRGDAREFRSERANELRILAEILSHAGRLLNTEPLISAASRVQSSSVHSELPDVEAWKCDVVSLRLGDIETEKLKRSMPSDVIAVELELRIRLAGPCLSDLAFCDPFVFLEIDILLQGLSEHSAGMVRCAWHFDRHLEATQADLDTVRPAYVHPVYHFQYGGDAVRNIEVHGGHLVLEPPRIAHPPMDVILAVDYVLSNYYPSSWLALRADSQYERLVKGAQRRWWAPYAIAIAAHWPFSNIVKSDVKWAANGIWPSLYD